MVAKTLIDFSHNRIRSYANGVLPLARGHKVRDPSLVQIAEILGCTPAQVAIKWCIDSGAITIPKSSNPDRIVENFHSQNIDITPVMEQLQSMDENYVSGWDPTVEI